MAVYDRQMLFVIAIAAVVGVVQSRAVNISNTWMLPEEGFPVFYRYFRDRISWYEADAVCQFHHANLVTADSTSQYDAIRAYLKELDISDKVWIGLSRTTEKTNFAWTDFRPLSGEGHWQESLPAGNSEALCAVMDPAADFLWRPLPCGGPEVAAFICELPIPSWALGPKGCLLTELPSLTVLYIPEQSAVELTSDCGLDGTKRIACKGNADHEEILRQLTCVISNEDFDDKSTKSSVTSSTDYETSTLDENSLSSKTTKSWIWTSNTIDMDYGMPTRHRRETEDTLSPVSTKSSFNQYSTTDLSWKISHHEDAVLTTERNTPLDAHVTPTPSTSLNYQSTTDTGTVATDDTATLDLSIIDAMSSEKSTHVVDNKAINHTQHESSTTKKLEMTVTTVTSTVKQEIEMLANQKTKNGGTESTRSSISPDDNPEEYPSAINQGQLFSMIENGTFDIIELNVTDDTQDSKPKEVKKTVTTTRAPQPTTEIQQKPINIVTLDSSIKKTTTSKKYSTKEPMTPTKKCIEKKELGGNSKITTTQNSLAINGETVDQIAENLTKEYEMMPDIKDTSLKLNRTFRKELLPINDENTLLENGGQYGVPRILNFSTNNNLDEGFQQDQGTNNTDTIVFSTLKENVNEEKEKFEPKVEDLVPAQENIDALKEQSPAETSTVKYVKIDPRIFLLNHHDLPKNNETEIVYLNKMQTEKPKIVKQDFLPKSLLGETTDVIDSNQNEEFEYSTEHPFPSEEPKKPNRKRVLSRTNKQRKSFYPYFFSRMLG